MSQPSNHGKLNCGKHHLTSQVGNNDNEIGHTHTHTHVCDSHTILCEMVTNYVGDYKKFINKKIITQKLNARRCKAQLNTFLIPGAS